MGNQRYFGHLVHYTQEKTVGHTLFHKKNHTFSTHWESNWIFKELKEVGGKIAMTELLTI